MNRYRYCGKDLKLDGQTALGRFVKGEFQVQVDNMDHAMGHNWHPVPWDDWRQLHTIDCDTCDGTGEVHSHNPRCWTCRGRGSIEFELVNVGVVCDEICDELNENGLNGIRIEAKCFRQYQSALDNGFAIPVARAWDRDYTWVQIYAELDDLGGASEYASVDVSRFQMDLNNVFKAKLPHIKFTDVDYQGGDTEFGRRSSPFEGLDGLRYIAGRQY